MGNGSELLASQIGQVRESGEANMLDVRAVQRVAFDMGLHELVELIEADREGYLGLLTKGGSGPGR